VKHKMNRIVSADMCVRMFLLTFGQRLADCQRLFHEPLGHKVFTGVERFEQDHSHLPHRGGSGSVLVTAVPLWRYVLIGA